MWNNAGWMGGNNECTPTFGQILLRLTDFDFYRLLFNFQHSPQTPAHQPSPWGRGVEEGGTAENLSKTNRNNEIN